MTARDKGEDELINELTQMRRRVAELESAAAKLRETEKGLRESEANYRAIFLRASEGIMVADASTAKFKYANPAICKMLGYTEDELIGLSISDIHPKDKVEYVASEFRAIVAGEKSRAANIPCLRKDGTVFRANVGGATITIDGLPCAVGFFSDITELKKGEEALARANEDWERTFRAISDGIMVLNSEHKILRANKTMASALEMTESELIGKSCFELVHGTKGPPAFCPHSQLLADGEEHRAEVVEPRLGATLDVRVSPIFDQNHKVIGSVHVVRDITERKRVEEALQDSEERLRLTLEATQIGIWDWNVKTDRWYASPTYYAMLGYEPKTGPGDRSEWLERVHFDDRAHVKQRIQDVLAKDFKEYQYEARLRHADGTYRWQHVRGMSVKRDKDGKVTRMLGIRMDIDERKRVEEALRASEEFHRVTISNISDAVLITEDNGAFTYVCPNTHLIFGYSQEEVEALGNISKLLGHELHDAFQRGNQQEIHNVDCAIKDKFGKHHALLVNIKRVDIKGGTVLYTCRDITDRKQAEESLREAGAFLETLLDAIPAPIFYKDTDGRYLGFNKAFEEFYGKTREELVGKSVFDIAPRKLAEVYHAKDLEVLRNAGVQVYGSQIKDFRGAVRDVLFHKATFSDPQGNVLGLIGVILDITERKRAEEALERANQEWERTFDAISDAVMVLDDRHEIVRANKAMADALGMTESELIGRHCFELVHGEKEPPVFCPHSQLLADGREHSVEVVEPRLGGTFDVRVSPLIGQNGQVIGSVHVIRDITERKQAEEKNLRLAAVVESSDDAIIGKSLDGMITSWNKGAANIYGYQHSEAVGKPISVLVPPDRQDEISRFLAIVKRGEHVEHCETVRRRKDGREIDISLTISPIRNAEGGIVGASTIARDITGQKSLQRQLLQAQKMEALGTLAGGIAHDFNNLLTVVLGFSELLLIAKDERDPSYADLQKIHQAARSGADLVQRILAFSRKTEINPRPLNLNHEIEQVKKLLDRTIPKMIEIGLLLSDELAQVDADPVQIEQILMNLAVNAKDAMPDGGKLTIETGNVALDEEYCRMHLGSKAGDYVLLSLSDTGHGMDNETLKHIFEPFYTTKGIGRGTGLGLAIVYGIVKQHGGYITCYSEPGMGTTFRIYLPVIEADAKSEAPTGKPTMPRGTERILLVDDDEFVRQLGKRILERSGYTVLTAARGKEALDLYKKERGEISLVILDLIMPEMGGKACLEELLKIDPRVKVVIASGYAAEGQTRDTIEAGARGFVGKPYDMKQMLQAVREVLDSD